ncbi:TPM domain-containing protein [Spirochaetota bacterium]
MILPLYSIEIPARTSTAINDYAGVIPSQNRNILEGIARAVYEQSKVALVVVLFNDIGQSDINDLANRLFEKWGIGDKATDEGVLIIATIKQRRWRIETGYGVEGMIPDARAKRIGEEYLVPAFRQQQYASGIINTMAAIIKFIEKEKNIKINFNTVQSSYQRAANMRGGRSSFSFIKLIFFAIIFIILISTPFGRTILFVFFLSSLFGGRGGRGGGFGGGGAGGFGGFGGGMSGGGGAGGSW